MICLCRSINVCPASSVASRRKTSSHFTAFTCVPSGISPLWPDTIFSNLSHIRTAIQKTATDSPQARTPSGTARQTMRSSTSTNAGGVSKILGFGCKPVPPDAGRRPTHQYTPPRSRYRTCNSHCCSYMIMNFCTGFSDKLRID